MITLTGIADHVQPEITDHFHRNAQPHLEKCLREYLESYNENPRALIWAKSVGVERSYPKQLHHHFVKDATPDCCINRGTLL